LAKKCKSTSSPSAAAEPSLSISQLRFGKLMQQGCNGAVYSADWNTDFTGKWPLAVKMMFNYDFESNASTIVRGMVKELVPAQHIDLQQFDGLEKG